MEFIKCELCTGPFLVCLTCGGRELKSSGYLDKSKTECANVSCRKSDAQVVHAVCLNCERNYKCTSCDVVHPRECTSCHTKYGLCDAHAVTDIEAQFCATCRTRYCTSCCQIHQVTTRKCATDHCAVRQCDQCFEYNAVLQRYTTGVVAVKSFVCGLCNPAPPGEASVVMNLVAVDVDQCNEIEDSMCTHPCIVDILPYRMQVMLAMPIQQIDQILSRGSQKIDYTLTSANEREIRDHCAMMLSGYDDASDDIGSE